MCFKPNNNLNTEPHNPTSHSHNIQSSDANIDYNSDRTQTKPDYKILDKKLKYKRKIKQGEGERDKYLAFGQSTIPIYIHRSASITVCLVIQLEVHLRKIYLDQTAWVC